MPFEIPDHFHSSFTTNVELLLQQKMPMMLRGVQTKSYSGESAQVIKQFGEVEFDEVTTRHGDTLFGDIQHKQRWVFPTDYNKALPVDKEDEIRSLNSPISPYAAAMRAAYARKVNVVIRDALLGSSQTGKNGVTVTAFDTTNQQIAPAATGLTLGKLRTAKEKFGLNEVDEDDELYFAVGSKQLTNLLATTEVTSADFNTVKALVQGQVDSFMGFKFIRNEKLGVDSNGDRRCIAWAKSGIVLGQWNGLETHIDVREDKNYLTQVFMKATIGATRTQEKKVIEVLCVET